MSMVVLSPIFMMEPLPCCLSIWLIAISRAFTRSTGCSCLLVNELGDHPTKGV